MTAGGSQLLTFEAAAKLLPPNRSGKPVHGRTLQGWADRGIRTKDGRTVKLGAVALGRRRFTTRGLLKAFIRDLNTPPP